MGKHTRHPWWDRAARQLTDARADTLLHNSGYGIVIVLANALLGYLFWTVAARLYSPHDIGIAAAVISAFTVASTLSNLGVGTGLVLRLPHRRGLEEWNITVTSGLTVGIAGGLVASVPGVFLLPHLSQALRSVWSPALAAGFVAGVLLWTLSVVLDFLFVAERAVKLSLARNLTFSSVKVALLAAPAVLGIYAALGIILAWDLGILFSVVVGVLLVSRVLGRPWTLRLAGLGGETRLMMSSFARNHLINLGGYLPMYLFPLIVTARLGVVQNAYGYVGWMIGSVALIVSPTVAANLLAESSRDAKRVDQHLIRGVKIMSLLMAPPMLVMLVLARPILSLFGAEYANHSLTLVQVLILSAIPDAITNGYVVRLRVAGRLTTGAALNLGMAAAALVAAWFWLPTAGISALAYSWIVAQTAGSAVAAADFCMERMRRRRAEHQTVA